MRGGIKIEAKNSKKVSVYRAGTIYLHKSNNDDAVLIQGKDMQGKDMTECRDRTPNREQEQGNESEKGEKWMHVRLPSHAEPVYVLSCPVLSCPIIVCFVCVCFVFVLVVLFVYRFRLVENKFTVYSTVVDTVQIHFELVY